ncbi:MAG: hypothetical protein ACP5DX_12495 [Paracoccaceae bacterium]
MTAASPTPDWNLSALNVLRQSLYADHDIDDLGGKTGSGFGRGLRGVNAGALPVGRVKRSEVFALAAEPQINTYTVCAAALAWGGMNMRFHKRFFDLADEGWLQVADDIRAGAINRAEAYDALSDLRHRDKLFGVGPAYFTKLIYFLTPRARERVAPGYIMDQWAGCSINLLVGAEIVRMDVIRKWRRGEGEPHHTFIVSDANTGSQYESFCGAMDALSEELGLSPDETDRALLANGGKDKSDWRQYVIDNRAI